MTRQTPRRWEYAKPVILILLVVGALTWWNHVGPRGLAGAVGVVAGTVTLLGLLVYLLSIRRRGNGDSP